ncbi:SH3 domain-containing protein [Qipengyuania sp. CAU 1752]
MHRLILSTLFVFVLTACGAGGPNERPTPYWASIDTTRLNMRVGPSTEYRIEWTYTRKGLPVKVLRLKEGWRYIEDPEGAQGWVVARMLSAERSALVTSENPAPMRAAPADNSALLWKLAPGVLVNLAQCEAGWCEVTLGKRHGYVPAGHLFGASAP